ncbi:gamma-glutamyltransferase [Kiloniella spongiae]|uniref:Gamma-glutamyltransferase n=1 Tax=Kiloniella spongiae TaxID=1489064 RepID=A0A0H2MI08_9PROT|nr:gamma-glutamyltransferase [Kiloniella spongiae]KLN60392.1 gamma-glutamyltransferase [Kiloniella spongiae]
MSHSFSRSQTVRKPATKSEGGIVAAQHVKAAEIGADILEQGGDAVDAAVAVSFAMGVLEPWMSGPAGGGAMMIWREAEQKSYALTYGMKSPKSLDPNAFPLSADGKAADLFPWRAVKGDLNVQGPLSIAVPGTVAGAGKAHNAFGKMPWKDLLQPAIKEAKSGLLVDWYAALIIASATQALSKDPDAAATFLEDRQWPTIAGWTALSEKRIDQSLLANTLTHLAEQGPEDFYRGDIAALMVKDIQDKGGFLSLDDLASYAIEFEDPLTIPYRDSRIFATPTLTAGPTLADTLCQMENMFTPGSSPAANSFGAYAEALSKAYEKRLVTMGDQDAPHAPSCTTHFSIVDRQGNMVSMTQTLLSLFGSRVISPSTGLLMNNGIMWFDPEQGHPNSLAPNKRCLMNVCPVIGEQVIREQGTDKQSLQRFAIGASGGRKIMPAVMQLSSFMTDYNMSLEDAFHHPRMDVSGGDVIIADEDLAPEIISELSQKHTVTTTKRTVFPYAFACPAGVSRENGVNSGCTEVMSPWGDAVAERDTK